MQFKQNTLKFYHSKNLFVSLGHSVFLYSIFLLIFQIFFIQDNGEEQAQHNNTPKITSIRVNIRGGKKARCHMQDVQHLSITYLLC